ASAGPIEAKFDLLAEALRPIASGTIELGAMPVEIMGGLDVPGHLMCRVQFQHEGKTQRVEVGAMFDPYELEPGGTEPADFDAFWASERAILDASPMKIELKPVEV